jgi:hypothetical protein
MTPVSVVVFTIALVVKEVIILGGFSQVSKKPFPSLFFWWHGTRGVGRSKVHTMARNTRATLGDLLVSIFDTHKW